MSLYMVLGLVLHQHAHTIVTKLQNQRQTVKTAFTDDINIKKIVTLQLLT